MKQEPHLHNAALCSPGAKQDLPPERADSTWGFTPEDSPAREHPDTTRSFTLKDRPACECPDTPGASHSRTAFIT